MSELSAITPDDCLSDKDGRKCLKAEGHLGKHDYYGKRTRSDKGKPRTKPDAKTAEAAITDIIHALMGVPKADIGRVLDAVARFHELDGKE